MWNDSLLNLCLYCACAVCRKSLIIYVSRWPFILHTHHFVYSHSFQVWHVNRLHDLWNGKDAHTKRILARPEIGIIQICILADTYILTKLLMFGSIEQCETPGNIKYESNRWFPKRIKSTKLENNKLKYPWEKNLHCCESSHLLFYDCFP